MKLSADDVQTIARLARLQVEQKEIADLERELSSILDFVEQMNQADVEGVEPMAHPLELVQRLREDQATEPNQRDHFQQNAPAAEDGLYLVPKVIE